jgi:acetolactate synthase-1/2/3 large subunit
MSLRDFIVSRLEDAGVRTLFGVPGGGGNLDLIDAAGRAGLPFVLTATETGSALAAVAQAEVTGRPGACLTTLGPGAASVANGVACAFLDRAPLAVFTDAYPVSAAGVFEHQQFDHQVLFRSITKWSGRLTPDCAYRTIDRAFASLLELPPGPVHVDCPGDFESAREPLDDPRTEEAPREPDRKPLDEARLAALVQHARKPLVIVGLGARKSEDAAAIRGFLERRGVPAMVTYKAKGVVPDGHRSFAGVFTNAAIERPIAQESDLILGIGLDPVELLPRPWIYSQPVVYLGRWAVSDRHIPFAAQHVANVACALDDVDALLRSSDWDLDEVRRKVEEQRRAIDVPAGGLTAQQVVRAAAERLASIARVTVDAGAHMLPATVLWPVSEPNGLLISNGLSTMGFALPAAIGAALADREKPVVALTGDGGLLMCAAELLTAAREKLRIIVILFCDASLSLIEIKQQHRQYRPSGVMLGPVGWRAVAEGFGVAAFEAATDTDLEHAVERALQTAGPSLIAASIDRSNYGRTIAIVRGT